MFYLIGGAPRSGKTTIAKKLSSELGVPWISTDTLESVVSLYVPEDKLAELFPKSVMRKETEQSNDLMYTKYSAEEIKNAYFKQANSLWGALLTFIECESKYGHEYILEGHHIAPEFITQFQDKYQMKSVFVGREDISATHEAIGKGDKENNWVISKTKDESVIIKIAEMLASYSRDVKTAAEKRNLHYIDISDDFYHKVSDAVNYLKILAS